MPENYVNIPNEQGSVNISEDVIAAIASAAMAEVDGIAGFGSTVGSEIYEFLGKKPASKGIRASFEDGKITVDIIAMVCYGNGIAKVASAAQSAVIAAVESMTGIAPVVNIHISGVAFGK